MIKLTSNRERFAIAMSCGDNKSQTSAYKESYNCKGMAEKTIVEAASRLMRDSKVLARIAELKKPVLDKAQLDLERVIKEDMSIAFFDIRTILDDDGAVKPVNEWPVAAGAAIASMEVLEQYEGAGKDRVFVGYLKKIKLIDKGGALDRLMKHLGGYKLDNEVKSNLMQEFYNMISGGSLPVMRDISSVLDKRAPVTIEAQKVARSSTYYRD